jgi:hypothetical protein
MRVELHLAAALCLLALAGCIKKTARPQSPAGSPYGHAGVNATNSNPQPIVIPDEGLDGKVSWFDPNLRFVVITFRVGRLPAIDRRLSVYREGLKVGEIKITGPQRDDSIVGDIVTGAAGPGDTVRDR